VIDIFGIEAVLANLEAFNVTTQRKIGGVVKSAAEAALEVANTLTPVSATGSHGNPPGTLKAGNAIREGASDMSMAARVTSGFTWELYNPVFYAGYVILGTRYMSARDFFTPAMAVGRAKMYAGVAAIAL
jgi:HK97 gp10 family phage protein